jgi:hypothetical protein
MGTIACVYLVLLDGSSLVLSARHVCIVAHSGDSVGARGHVLPVLHTNLMNVMLLHSLLRSMGTVCHILSNV